MANTYGRTHYVKRSKRKSRYDRQKLIIQKLMGFGMLAICALMVLMAYYGKTVEDRDCTAILILAPTALYLLFVKRIVVF